MQRVFKLDGKPVEVDIVEVGRGLIDVYVLGLTLTGRKARVSCHRLPEWFGNIGGCIKTGGHTYELVSNPGERRIEQYA